MNVEKARSAKRTYHRTAAGVPAPAPSEDVVSHDNSPRIIRPRMVSLFSGCGGLDKGFELAGFQRVFANDFDKDAKSRDGPFCWRFPSF